MCCNTTNNDRVKTSFLKVGFVSIFPKGSDLDLVFLKIGSESVRLRQDLELPINVLSKLILDRSRKRYPVRKNPFRKIPHSQIKTIGFHSVEVGATYRDH